MGGGWPLVSLSSGPPSAERAARNGVCAIAHTKGAGILSGAHRRASVDARCRRAPALDLPSEAPSTARGRHGWHKLKSAAALRSGCFRCWMKGLVSEQPGRGAMAGACGAAWRRVSIAAVQSPHKQVLSNAPIKPRLAARSGRAKHLYVSGQALPCRCRDPSPGHYERPCIGQAARLRVTSRRFWPPFRRYWSRTQENSRIHSAPAIRKLLLKPSAVRTSPWPEQIPFFCYKPTRAEK